MKIHSDNDEYLDEIETEHYSQPKIENYIHRIDLVDIFERNLAAIVSPFDHEDE